MGCRAQFWSIIGALALLWACGGSFVLLGGSQSATESAAATMAAKGEISQSEIKSTASGGSAIIAGLGLPFFLCTGLPIALIAAFLANANRRGAREEKRHKEQLQVMQTSAAAQVAQAQMQYAQSQPQSRTIDQPASLPSGNEVKHQLEAAKALIDAKQYAAARNLLKTINHPKATEWLAKLEKM